MNFIKIYNLINEQGVANYKGLDLAKIIAGTQLYPSSVNVAYIGYVDDEIPQHEDLQIVTEDEYLQIKNEIEANRPKPPEELQERIDLMQQAVDDLLLGGM
ncbi:hypothetical protein [Cytobacillus firmus]|uniref:hypothetical protein n=1 Tax=Cytobacillus firmus TaxID=1399 RepID=UPI0018CEEAE1|nr:hypothetical protein [Cytobacillus firmus]MBG9655008.1 hypothetical protein [Cytobacillus firmus]MBG9655009.1 hypothetical protein [Cytobacillus firmus]MBG9655040.1 hypothetical protein [Cytobacillus firmus]MBG9655403.1 hypothetical protein [Cytobacillus firmus]MED1909007.1 hypothetical protein [Cytobacillus firmus]